MSRYAVLGATGAVGQACVQRLATRAAAIGGTVRLGGRDRTRLEALATALSGHVEVVPTDMTDDASLSAFCEGAKIVANCAGPSYAWLDRVARAAWSAGADVVDIGGELGALQQLRTHAPSTHLEQRTAVFSAGVMPGLSGLLPRLLCQKAPPRRLDSYVGGAQVFTPLSAVDGLLTRGEQFGTPSAVAIQGNVVEGRLTPLHGVTLPGFTVAVHAWPYLTTEAQALGAAEHIDEVRAYNVFVSNRLPHAMAAAWAELGVDAPLDAITQAADAVVHASEADRDEHGQFYVMLFTARPRAGHSTGPTRVVLTATDSYQVSGAVMAEATRQVEEGLGPGAHLAARALDPSQMVRALAEDPSVHTIDVG